ncbi:MAG TPA: hypothetical protein PL060_07235, partial [bacterium]|nr:hypothetical protein [bacterium]
EIRYLLMTTHYRDPLNFTEQSLKQAEKTIKHVQAFYQRISFALENEEHSRQVHQDIEKYINEASEGFVGALSDDLNISLAMSEVFKFMHGINEICEKNKITGGDAKKIIEFFDRINEVIAIIEPVEKLPEEIVNLIKKREQARKEKNFTLADQIRNTLAESGIVLEDTPYGTRWIRK